MSDQQRIDRILRALERQSEASEKRPFRWFRFLVIPALLNALGAVLFPMFLTVGLTFSLLLICGAPALWSVYMLLSFRSRPERVIAYITAVTAIFWAIAALHLLISYGLQ